MSLLPRLLLASVGALLASGVGRGVDASLQADLVAEDGQQRLDSAEPDRPIADLESNLLALLGLSKRPRPRPAQSHVPESLRQLYRRQSATGDVDVAKRGINAGSANTVRSFLHLESEIDGKFKSAHSFRLSFNVSSVPASEKLHAAELTFHRKSLKLEKDEKGPVPNHLKLMVYDIVRPGIKGKNKPLLRLIDSKVLDIRSNASLSTDVRPAVERWMSKAPGHSQNHGLLVKVVGKATLRAAHVRLRRSQDEADDIWRREQPRLLTYTDDGRKKMSTASDILERRARRAALRKNRRKDGRENCRRHPLYVDFADVGWNDWIVAPPGYEAFYCHGECPYPLLDHMNATKHALVQNIVHSTDPSRAPTACCVPTSLGAVSILYFDDHNEVVLKNYRDMSVLECGCR